MATHTEQLRSLLTDPGVDRETRLLRLQGWRGQALDQAVLAGHAHRLGPASCALLGAGVAATGSASLALGTTGLSAIGAVALNHPIEAVYNTLARRLEWAAIPPNRAAKRLGCAIGSLFFLGSAVAFATGASTVGTALALVIAALAAFVAATNVCVPSIVFTLLWGEARGTAPDLFATRPRARPASGIGAEPVGR